LFDQLSEDEEEEEEEEDDEVADQEEEDPFFMEGPVTEQQVDSYLETIERIDETTGVVNQFKHVRGFFD